MSDVDFTTITRPITRDQIAAAVGNNPRAIRVIEHLVEDISGTLPGYLAQMQTELRVAQSRVEALEEALERSREAGEVARASYMAAIVEQVREQVAGQDSDGMSLTLAGQVAELRELVAIGGKMKVRTINDTVLIPTGNTEANYTISPALASVDRAFVVFNGSWSVYGAGGGTMLITSTTNLNFKMAAAVAADTYGRFSLVEFQ